MTPGPPEADHSPQSLGAEAAVLAAKTLGSGPVSQEISDRAAEEAGVLNNALQEGAQAGRGAQRLRDTLLLRRRNDRSRLSGVVHEGP